MQLDHGSMWRYPRRAKRDFQALFVLQGMGLFCPAPVLLPSRSRQKGALYVDEEFKFHLWHGGVTELVSVPIVSGAADQWPENPEDGKRSMMMHPVRQDVSFDARILTSMNVS
jgi:hypothetical protein